MSKNGRRVRIGKVWRRGQAHSSFSLQCPPVPFGSSAVGLGIRLFRFLEHGLLTPHPLFGFSSTPANTRPQCNEDDRFSFSNWVFHRIFRCAQPTVPDGEI